MIVTKFSTLGGGVFIEENGTDCRLPTDRCFRFDRNGNSEFAYFAVLSSNDPSPRWYGHQYKEANFILC